MIDNIKRRKIYRYLKRYNVDIALLQETHGDKQIKNMWSNQWGSKCVYSHGTHRSKGVAILFNKKLSKAVKDIVRDEEGRFVICTLNIQEYEYCIANIYGLTLDDPALFRRFFDEIHKLDCTHVIVGGDFNVVLDKNKDRENQLSTTRRT